MRALVCPDKFRGSLSSPEATERICEGLVAAGIVDLTRIPMADGGEGTLTAVLEATDGQLHYVDTVDALGRPLRSAWGMLPDGTAVVEAATSVGLALLGEDRDPVEASSVGLGRVIASVLAQRPRRLLVAVGGVATSDGGLGCLDELDWSLGEVPTVVACDVAAAFVDAATVFGPQKGATAAQVAILSARLEQLASRFATEARDVAHLPGTGAAGGIAGGLAALGAQLRPGFELVADMVGLRAAVDAATVVVTGEGRLDQTSFRGKVVGGVLDLVVRAQARAIVLTGVAESAALQQARALGAVALTLRESAIDDADSFARAGDLLAAAASKAVGMLPIIP